jgi:putative FmdB family regulatory protein
MPIYEYECAKCGASFEALLRTQGDEKKVACEACGSRRIERKPSVFAAHEAAPARSATPRCQRGGCGSCCDDGMCCME